MNWIIDLFRAPLLPLLRKNDSWNNGIPLSLWAQMSSIKTTWIGIYIIFNHPNKIEGKVDSVDRQRITAKYFRRSNLKKNRQILGIYIGIWSMLGYSMQLCIMSVQNCAYHTIVYKCLSAHKPAAAA
jgi:hypothetical protein